MSFDLLAASALILAYLMGSVSTAILVCRAMRLPDPRLDGSRNPGTTNVLRLGGKPAALLTLAGDLLKGVIPVLVARHYGLNDAWLAGVGFAAFIGHLYPIFFGFEGGKGVATALGVLLALDLRLGGAAVGLWLLSFALTRISSVGALVVFVLMPFLAYYWQPAACPLLSLMSVLLLYRHKSNIHALLRGSERGFKR